MRLSIRLGPHSNLARFFEGRILGLQILLAIQIALDVITRHGNPKAVPSWRRAGLGTFDFRTAPIHHMIKIVIILKWIETGHVVVLCVSGSSDNATALIGVSCNGFHLHRDVDVLIIGVVDKRYIEGWP